jgi:hypothetical protein
MPARGVGAFLAIRQSFERLNIGLCGRQHESQPLRRDRVQNVPRLLSSFEQRLIRQLESRVVTAITILKHRANNI